LGRGGRQNIDNKRIGFKKTLRNTGVGSKSNCRGIRSYRQNINGSMGEEKKRRDPRNDCLNKTSDSQTARGEG